MTEKNDIFKKLLGLTIHKVSPYIKYITEAHSHEEEGDILYL